MNQFQIQNGYSESAQEGALCGSKIEQFGIQIAVKMMGCKLESVVNIISQAETTILELMV